MKWALQEGHVPPAVDNQAGVISGQAEFNVHNGSR